jgi:hypothetical protein
MASSFLFTDRTIIIEVSHFTLILSSAGKPGIAANPVRGIKYLAGPVFYIVNHPMIEHIPLIYS